MRTFAITAILALAATTALPFGAAEAACLPDDLGCTVHGGSGMVFDRGGFMPRGQSGNMYVDRATRRVTSPRTERQYRRSTTDRTAPVDNIWDGLSDWQELGPVGSTGRQLPSGSGISSTELDGETATGLDEEQEVNPRLRRRVIQRTPQAPASTGQLPARGPTGIADSPQSATNSIGQNRATRR